MVVRGWYLALFFYSKILKINFKKVLTYRNVYDIMYLSTTKQHKILKQHSKKSNSKLNIEVKSYLLALRKESV